MTFFAEELRKCLNAAGLSDCGENDCWNYWYERIMASFNEAVDRATRTEQAENAKLRELVKDMWPHVRHRSRMCGECKLPCDTSDECLLYEPMRQRMRELGIEVDDA